MGDEGWGNGHAPCPKRDENVSLADPECSLVSVRLHSELTMMHFHHELSQRANDGQGGVHLSGIRSFRFACGRIDAPGVLPLMPQKWQHHICREPKVCVALQPSNFGFPPTLGTNSRN